MAVTGVSMILIYNAALVLKLDTGEFLALNILYGMLSGIAITITESLIRAGSLKELRTQSEFLFYHEKLQETEELIEGRIVLQGVRFSYPGKPVLLDGIDLEINSGEMIGIYGAVGSGKTTLTNILLGMLEAEGEIILDGRTMKQSMLAGNRGDVAAVFRENSMIRGTIGENLLIKDSCNNDKLPANSEIIKKARQMIDEFYTSDRSTGVLFNMNTELDDGGTVLSNGERQMLQLVRVLVHSPKLLLLDEAVSCMDEKLLTHVLEYIKKTQITCILFSHRESVFRFCNRRYELYNGKLYLRE